MPRKTAPETTAPETTPVAAEEIPQENLQLWDWVQATDPKYTKSFSRSGGFRGTAINHTYQQKRATTIFGPKGEGWGSHVLEEDYVKGAPLIHEKHGVVGQEVVHVLRIELWYIRNGRRCAVEAFGQTTFVGSNKHGFYTDEEAPKKSLTDAESKALASLGFSADVHLGLFDDVKYVNDLKAKAEEADKPKGPSVAELIAKVEASANVDELKAAVVQASTLSDADKATLKVAYLAKQTALKGAP